MRPPADAIVWRCIQLPVNKLARIGTNSYRLAQITSDWHKLSQIGTNYHRLAQITLDWHKLPQVGANYHRLAQFCNAASVMTHLLYRFS